MIRELWRWRGLAQSLVRRDLEVRSVRALWGNAWLVINPAIQILIYVAVFAEILRAKLPGDSDRLAYALYLCAGLIAWNHFAELVARGQNLFQEHAPLLKGPRFPRSLLPLSLLGSSTIRFAFVGAVFMVLLVSLDRWPGLATLGALPLFACQVMLGLGLGILAGTLNVFFHDVGQIVPILMQFWFWLTPVVYPLEIVPEALRRVLVWNPMLPILSGYQRIVLSGQWPDWWSVAPAAAVSLGVGLLSWIVFRTLNADLQDEL